MHATRHLQAAQVACYNLQFSSAPAWQQGIPIPCDDHCCRYHSPSHPLRLVSGEAGVGRVRVVVDGKRDWHNVDFEIGYAVWHEVITASCNVLPARAAAAPGAAGSGEDLRGTFFLNVSPPAPDCAPVRRLVHWKLNSAPLTLWQLYSMITVRVRRTLPTHVSQCTWLRCPHFWLVP